MGDSALQAAGPDDDRYRPSPPVQRAPQRCDGGFGLRGGESSRDGSDRQGCGRRGVRCRAGGAFASNADGTLTVTHQDSPDEYHAAQTIETPPGSRNMGLDPSNHRISVLPNLPLFIYAYVRKEAVLSSQIEGTQSSLSDLLLFESDETPGVPLNDVQEVSRYAAALNHGLQRLRGGFPLSLRLIREIHEMLLSSGRGSDKQPGEFRQSQNWIGGTRPGTAAFVPPPPDLVLDCMSALELFLHDERPDLPVLIKAGLVHVQFETIHPFLDGNGRLGRLLIAFQLCAAGVLREPILYLSLYLKQHRTVYYDLLDRVRAKGDWEAWLDFFLTGVGDTAEQAAAAARRIPTKVHSRLQLAIAIIK